MRPSATIESAICKQIAALPSSVFLRGGALELHRGLVMLLKKDSKGLA
jgi:hypothetical protein